MNFFSIDDDNTPGTGHLFCYNLTQSTLDEGLLLDLGCWTGKYLSLMSNQNVNNLVGIDINLQALNVAKKRVYTGSFIQASILSLPFKTNVFSIITLWAVLEHLPVQQEICSITEAIKPLKNKGIFFLSTTKKNILALLFDPAYILKKHRHYSLNELTSLLSLCGLSIVRKYDKGGIINCLTTLLYYFEKYFLKKTVFHKYMLPIERREYLKNNGFNMIYLKMKSYNKENEHGHPE